MRSTPAFVPAPLLASLGAGLASRRDDGTLDTSSAPQLNQPLHP